MRQEKLNEAEQSVLKELEALFAIGDILTHDTLKSVILSCTNTLDE